MKELKKEGAQIMAFYVGGVKFHASVTHTKEELEDMVGLALKNDEPAIKLNTINEDPTIADDCLIMTLDNLLFCSIIVKNDSGIVTLPRDGRLVQ
jgi:hypothetical protein